MNRTLKAALVVAIALTALYFMFGPRTTAPVTTSEPTTISAATQHPTSPVRPPAPSEQVSSPDASQVSPTVGEGRTGDTTPTPTITESGADDHPATLSADEHSSVVSAAQTFVTGWLTPDPDQRRRHLTGVTAEALLDQLSSPHIRTWTTTPAGPPTLRNHTSTAATARQHFTDGRTIDLFLLTDPAAAPHGWLVVDVAPVTS